MMFLPPIYHLHSISAFRRRVQNLNEFWSPTELVTILGGQNSLWRNTHTLSDTTCAFPNSQETGYSGARSGCLQLARRLHTWTENTLDQVQKAWASRYPAHSGCKWQAASTVHVGHPQRQTSAHTPSSFLRGTDRKCAQAKNPETVIEVPSKPPGTPITVRFLSSTGPPRYPTVTFSLLPIILLMIIYQSSLLFGNCQASSSLKDSYYILYNSDKERWGVLLGRTVT